MSTHPIEKVLSRMSKRDQKIANALSEAGFSDEDLYAATSSPGAVALLQNMPKPKKPNTPKEKK